MAPTRAHLPPRLLPRIGPPPVAEATQWHAANYAAGDKSLARTEQGDEIAALQLIELHSMLSSQTRIARYRIGRGQSVGYAWVLL
jgi:hypothetical protein